jgi:glycosyltransferase involved in cell wall biosynthesis
MLDLPNRRNRNIMEICIDMRPYLSEATGVGVYLINLVKALIEIDSKNKYHLFSSSWKDRFEEPFHGKNVFVHDKHWPVRVLNYSWNHFSFPTMESLVGTPLDVVHSPTPLLIPSKVAHQITTVHDLYFYFHPDQVIGEMRRDYPTMLLAHCLKSDAIIAVSEHTKGLLIEHLKIPSSKIYTVHHGADLFFAERVSSAETEAVKKTFGIERPYFIFVGSLEPRKNVSLLLEAFQKMSSKFQLVLCGPEGWGDDLSAQIVDGVIQTGYVSKPALRALYQNAIALVLPSFDEGFGLPILEAMASGIPIIASKIPAICEIGGDAFIPVDTESTTELRQAMCEVFSDTSLRDQLIAKGNERLKRFTWKEAAKKTLDIYEHL